MLAVFHVKQKMFLKILGLGCFLKDICLSYTNAPIIYNINYGPKLVVVLKLTD